MIDFAVQLFNSSNLTRRLPFSEGILQFWTTNQEQPESTFALRNREIEKHRYFQGSSTKFKEIQQENNTFTARDRYCMAPHLFSHQNNFFSVSNACLIVIIHHFSYHPYRKLRSSWDLFPSGQRTSFFSSVPKLTSLILGNFSRNFFSVGFMISWSK